MAIQGSCHCGKTRFEVAEPPSSVTACTCSYCAKVGALWAYCEPDGFKLLTPETDRAEYRWGSRTIRHFFCDSCGCSTYGISPTWVDNKEPDFSRPRLGINARLLDDFDLGTIPHDTIDGKNLW